MVGIKTKESSLDYTLIYSTDNRMFWEYIKFSDRVFWSKASIDGVMVIKRSNRTLVSDVSIEDFEYFYFLSFHLINRWNLFSFSFKTKNSFHIGVFSF